MRALRRFAVVLAVAAARVAAVSLLIAAFAGSVARILPVGFYLAGAVAVVVALFSYAGGASPSHLPYPADHEERGRMRRGRMVSTAFGRSRLD